MARFVAIAVLLAIGAGVYAFIQASNLKTAEMRLANTEKELGDWKKRMSQYTAENKTLTADIAQCKTQVTELQTALETASKRPGAKR
jgi:uncharacterized protein HemX